MLMANARHNFVDFLIAILVEIIFMLLLLYQLGWWILQMPLNLSLGSAKTNTTLWLNSAESSRHALISKLISEMIVECLVCRIFLDFLLSSMILFSDVIGLIASVKGGARGTHATLRRTDLLRVLPLLLSIALVVTSYARWAKVSELVIRMVAEIGKSYCMALQAKFCGLRST